MARTRGEIIVLSELHHGRTDKDTLMDSLCDTALKVALIAHPFKDACSLPDDFSITEDATSVDISATDNIVHIVTARIVEADGTQNERLWLKGRQWWDTNVINPEDSMKGWPVYGLRWGTNIILDRPAISGLELRLRVTTTPTFTDDDTECSIELLDIFVEQYVTAYVFHSIGEKEAFYFWKKEALGPRFDSGIVGGSLLAAINTDKFDPAEELRAGDEFRRLDGLAVLNLNSDHPRYGETDWWK